MAKGKAPKTTKVRDAMSDQVCYCFDDEDTDDIADNMGELQARRLPVVSHDKRLVGIVSLTNVARKADAAKAGEAMEGVTQPGNGHTRTAM